MSRPPSKCTRSNLAFKEWNSRQITIYCQHSRRKVASMTWKISAKTVTR